MVQKKKDRKASNLSPAWECAMSLAAQEIQCFPVEEKGKTPLVKWVEEATADVEQLGEWFRNWPESNLGIKTGVASGFFVLDVDGNEGERTLAMLQEKFGELPQTVEVSTGRGRHFLFQMPNFDVRNSTGKIGEKIDIRANGGYIVGPGSIHENGKSYVGEIVKEKIAPAPKWLLEKLMQPAQNQGEKKKRKTEHIPEGERNDTLFRHACSMRNAGFEEEAIFAALLKFNEKNCQPPLPESEVELIAGNASEYEAGQIKKTPKERALAPEEFDKFALTDMGNAMRLVMFVRNKVVFCAALGGWLLYDGGRWIRDTNNRILRSAKKTIREMYHQAAEIEDDTARNALLEHALKSQAGRCIRPMIELAQPELAVAPEVFDANPWLLNVTNGIINLKTMELCEHCPEEYQTKLAPVAFDESAECPIWMKVIDRITGNDREMGDYMQRVVGYCLTGLTSERCMFIIVGNGANGKTTFLNTISELLGDYAMATPVETLMVRNSGSIPNDIARLRGARFVTASEGELGQRLAESLVKRLTGQDRIAARFLHREFFEYLPQFKVILASNHLPQIRGSDHGIWDRLRLIHFRERIPESERDQELPEKLKAELSGILNWAIEGFRQWRRRGLDTPESVRAATGDYRKEMDLFGRFLDDTTVPDPDSKVKSAALYERYRTWCDDNGERVESKKMVGLMLAERGLESRKIQGYPYWLGFKLSGLL